MADWKALSRRGPEFVDAVHRDGFTPTARRVAGRLAAPFVATSSGPNLLDGDIVDVRSLELPLPAKRPERTRPLEIAWVCSPPAPGSGGHTTAFRMIEALEAAGHVCWLYLYDTARGDMRRHEETIRTHWPALRAPVHDALAPAAWAHLDAYVATGWESAHVVASRAAFPTRRCYFVQDYEPFFYPRGWEYVLAQDTYRMGFATIAVGRMVAALLDSEFGTRATLAEFGCDTAVYRMRNGDRRHGVAMHARPGVARRAFELGMLGLAEFHRLHPNVRIHLYGDTDHVRAPFPIARHGKLAPTDLAELYNECVAGVAMSFTNISLVAEELLACGTIPVVNDDRLARMDLENPHVEWAAPTPSSIAQALAAAYENPDAVARAAAAAASVRPNGWTPAAAATVGAIEDEVYGRAERA